MCTNHKEHFVKKDGILYHYTSADALESIIRTKKFRLGSSLTMDDTTEKTYGIKCLKEYFHAQKTEISQYISKLLTQNEIDECIDQSLEIPFYIVSFGQTPDNSDLWYRYGKGKKGICIELNKDVFKEEMDKRIIQLDPESSTDIGFPEFYEVHYSDYDEYIDAVLKDIKRVGMDPLCPAVGEKLLAIQFIQYVAFMIVGCIKKDSSWEQQDEIRLLYKFNPTKPSHLDTDYSLIKAQNITIEKNISSQLGLYATEQEKIVDGKKFLEFNLSGLDFTKMITRIFVPQFHIRTKSKLKRILKENGLNWIEIVSVKV